MAWIKMGEADRVPKGDLKEFTVSNTEFLVVNLDGQWKCFDARCSHAGAPLVEGELEGTILTCPWHGSRFDVRDGRVLGGPARKPLRAYPIKAQDGYLYVEI